MLILLIICFFLSLFTVSTLPKFNYFFYVVHILFILSNISYYLCSGWTGILSNKFNELYVPQCKLYMEYCFSILILSLYE